MNPYLVPAGEGSAEFSEKKSRFIGNIYPVESAEQAAEIVKSTQKRLWDASHNVWAYTLLGGAMRFSDDGEPQGTAGLPTLEVLKREEIVNALCVTTRYFGGTLLGAGGLTRAYSRACKLALDTAGIARMTPFASMMVKIPYSFLEPLRKRLPGFEAEETAARYADDVELDIVLPIERRAHFELEVAELTAGSVSARFLCEKMFAKKVK